LGLDNVYFAGYVSDDDLLDYYMVCDLFVLPSVTRQEAFGLVLVEAMAFGKPVISTNFSGMPYVVGDAGLLVEPRNPKALVEAINKILSDPVLSAELGRRGRRRVEELFEREVVCKKIREAYTSAIL
jgi:glycosyltransferase involved in cell wall biosynthesis